MFLFFQFIYVGSGKFRFLCARSVLHSLKARFRGTSKIIRLWLDKYNRVKRFSWKLRGGSHLRILDKISAKERKFSLYSIIILIRTFCILNPLCTYHRVVIGFRTRPSQKKFVEKCNKSLFVFFLYFAFYFIFLHWATFVKERNKSKSNLRMLVFQLLPNTHERSRW